jgi:hypothetical protein
LVAGAQPPSGSAFRLLIATQGRWGERIATNVLAHAPGRWAVAVVRLPAHLPLIVEDADEFLPADLPAADLLLALCEATGAAQLIPPLVVACGARAVIAPIDRNASLPPGLVRQVGEVLRDLGVAAVFPKPFCSLGLQSHGRQPVLVPYEDERIRRFARRFGEPAFVAEVSDGRVSAILVEREAACGCARHVASGLIGVPVSEAVQEAGMLHAHYPCLADMVIDPQYRDTLMHVSGHILQDAVRASLEPHLPPVAYLRPDGLVEAGADSAGPRV